MMKNTLLISKSFRKMAQKSVLSILLFLGTYLFLVACALGLVFLCGLLGYWLVMLYAAFVTGMVAVGLLSFALLVLFFLLKFVFSKNKTDRSHLIEIKETEQPQLFSMIRDIVAEVETQFPKKIFISSEVNAAVFYDSSFWSMFFPVRKNLVIGLGLINSVSVLELKAVLAHEFGHFSQRSMKVGSYVYNVNQVIYNMLYHNESYEHMIQKWSGISNYFALFAMLAVKIVTFIQFILKKVYTVVNLNYMALSREMEFHADAVAAHVTGSAPLVSSLLRTELADEAMNRVFNYYDFKIKASEKTSNFYPLQKYVMNHIGRDKGLPFEHDLPQVTQEFQSRFNKSKLVLKDQWSSHPSTEDRIQQLQLLNIPVKGELTGSASTLLNNAQSLEERVTAHSFSSIAFEQEPIVHEQQNFIEDFNKHFEETSFPKLYNDYFIYRSPYTSFELEVFEDVPEPSDSITAEGTALLFSDDVIDLIYTVNSLSADIAVLEQIYGGQTEIKTFEYDGEKYTDSNCFMLLTGLKQTLEEINQTLDHQDQKIFYHFLYLARTEHKLEEFKQTYLQYSSIVAHTNDQELVYNKMAEAVQFMSVSTPNTAIQSYLVALKEVEPEFKAQIEIMLGHPAYQQDIDEKIKADFIDYLAEDLKYFEKIYANPEVDLLFNALGAFNTLSMTTHLRQKKQLLQYQTTLVN
ncbi:M48 family metalloprotease [Pedobacter sp. MC2016-14]|uniref:M48 family metallopeptidase n=1 Tax=Pedobacter sp. MC2016-14 TaxID=2897327 RepID=UPI001E3054AA|nr:M48 family metallopeptidase [Pedobacter sp. MC2016-14]MCD0489772.1 M48 family metalloprotease [Pedobacter sp. MC2016-14]